MKETARLEKQIGASEEKDKSFEEVLRCTDPAAFSGG